MSPDVLEIRGARVHNLKNVNLRLPHNCLVVVTGVSGSGKSSLVFDTVYAEGQRRYVESLSAYARQFLERIEKPDVDEITGIAPAVAIRQKNQTRNPRSTVATATEIYDFLRLLFARAGVTLCANCGGEVSKDPVDRAAARVLAEPERSRWYALFPAVSGAEKRSADQLKARLTELRGKGFNRLYQSGRTFEFSTPESLLDVDFDQPVYVLVDRIVVSPESRERIVDALEIGYRESREALFEPAADGAEPLSFSERFECRRCGLEYPEPEPRLFSFNSPFGACPRCQGFGNTVDYDMALVLPDPFKTLKQGAVDPWTKPKYRDWQKRLLDEAGRAGVRVDTPFHELDEREREFVLDGDGAFPGVEGFFEFLETKKYKMSVRLLLARYRGYTSCPECGGGRLRKEALNVQVGGKNIRDVVRLSLEEAGRFFESLELPGERGKIADQLLRDVRHRLGYLNEVGLEYLTLDRLTSTLSGGEAQRIQLASSLGSRLVGACYVLDEPSIGLHSRDTGRLIGVLERLRDLGNTILVVEHDPEMMRAANWLVDLGPGAGEHGGEVIFSAPAAELGAAVERSLTAKYLSGRRRIPIPARRRRPNSRKLVQFYGAMERNLKNIDVKIPVGLFTVVTGVSGSGKSTLVHDVIYAALERGVAPRAEGEDVQGRRPPCRRVAGASYFEETILVDQSPIGRSPRSNPVTYVKAFDEIRKLFAETPEAQRRGFKAGHFSFNVPGGRCEACQGDGTVTVEMQFLADVELVCEECGGKRFGPDVLEVRYRGKNVDDVLRMPVEEALEFFVRTPKVVYRLAPLAEVGLGYLRLGQAATTLSGGEAQRVKLASHIGQAKCDATLFIFDEPTTGLHFDDIAKLLTAFEKLIEAGGTVLTIEHNLDVIKCADWVIDLGPEGGEGGGRIVAEGPPEEVALSEESHTGRYLRRALEEASAA